MTKPATVDETIFNILNSGIDHAEVLQAIADLNAAWQTKYEKKVRQLEVGDANQKDLQDAVRGLNAAWKEKYEKKIAKLQKGGRTSAPADRKEILKAVAQLNASWEEKYEKKKKELARKSRGIDKEEVREAVTELNKAWESKYNKKVGTLKNKLASAEKSMNSPKPEPVRIPSYEEEKEALEREYQMIELMQENRRLKTRLARIEMHCSE